MEEENLPMLLLIMGKLPVACLRGRKMAERNFWRLFKVLLAITLNAVKEKFLDS